MEDTELPEGFEWADKGDADPSVPFYSKLPDGYEWVDEPPDEEEGDFSVPAPQESNALVGGLKRTSGQILQSAGRLTGSQTLADKGIALIEENQAQIRSLSQIPSSPGTFAAETAGELLPDIAAQSAATATGAGIGLAVGGPVGAAIGAAGGRYGYSFLRSYDSIKQDQEKSGNINELRAITGALVAAGLDFIGPVSKTAGKIGRSIFQDGREKVLKELAEASPDTLVKYGLTTAKGAGKEAVTEVGQEVVEGFAGEGKAPGFEELGMAGAKGVFGGGVTTVAESAFGSTQEKEADRVRREAIAKKAKEAREQRKNQTKPETEAEKAQRLRQASGEDQQLPPDTSPHTPLSPEEQASVEQSEKEKEREQRLAELERKAEEEGSTVPKVQAEKEYKAEQAKLQAARLKEEEKKAKIEEQDRQEADKQLTLLKQKALETKRKKAEAKKLKLEKRKADKAAKLAKAKLPKPVVQAPPSVLEGTFSQGKYQGKTHKEVAQTSPEFIISEYEKKGEKSGIREGIYKLAKINLDEENRLSEGGLDFQHEERTVKNPYSVDTVKKIANTLVQNWANKPDIHVFSDFETDPDIPSSVKRLAAKRGIKNPTAFRVGSRVYLNSSKMGSALDVQTNMHHEAVGHIATEMFHGDEVGSIYDNVYNSRPEEASRLVAANKYDPTNKNDIRKVGAEIIANIAQTNPKHSLVRAAIVGIRNWLRKRGFQIKLRDADIIENYILPAKDYYTRGNIQTPSGVQNFTGKTDEDLKNTVATNAVLPQTRGAISLAETDRANAAQKELEIRERIRESRETDFSHGMNRTLYKLREQYQKELDVDSRKSEGYKMSPEQRERLEKHIEEIDNEIYQNNVQYMKKMVKSKNKRLQDFGTDFQHNFGDYSKMEDGQLKNLYLDSILRGNKETQDQVYAEMEKRGINPNRVPKYPQFDDLGELPPDATIGDLEADEFSREVAAARTIEQEQANYRPAIRDIQTGERLDTTVKEEDREASEGQTDFQHDLETTEDKRVHPFWRPYDWAKKFIRSTSDILKDSGGKIAELGQAIQNMVDYAQVNRGNIQRYMVPISTKLEKSSKSDRVQAISQFERWARATAQGTDFDEDISPLAQELMDAVRNALDTTGRKMESIGMMAKDPKTDKKIPFKMRKDFIPSILLPKYRSAITNPYKNSWNSREYTNDFKEIADNVIAAGVRHKGKTLDTHEQVHDYLRDIMAEGDFESGFYGNMGMSKKDPFPEEFYDRSLDAMRKYMDRAAERTAQVEAFTTTNKEGKKVDLFDEVLSEEYLDKKDPRRDYIQKVKQLVYQDRFFNSEWTKVGQTLNVLATGTQLSGPQSVWTNFSGGVTNVMALLDMEASMKTFRDVLSKDIRASVAELANNLGITSDDALRLLSDIEALGLSKYSGLNKVSKSVSDLTANLMSLNRLGPFKAISFNTSENAVRLLSTLGAKNQLNIWIREYNSNPTSSKSAVFEQFAREEGIDINKLLDEVGYDDIDNSPQTARFFRRMVNRIQGSYRLDQVPRFLDSSFGRFLWKYSKYGFQLGRMFDKQVVGYIRNPATRAEGLQNLVKYFGAYTTMGYMSASIIQAIFGDVKLPDWEELEKQMAKNAEDKDNFEKGLYLLQMVGNSINVLGAFGPISIAWQKIDQFQQYGENPLAAPGLSVLENLSKLLGKWMWSGTQGDVADAFKDSTQFMLDNVAFVRQNMKIVGRLGLDNYLAAKRVQSQARQAVRRFVSDSKDIKTNIPEKNWFPVLPNLLPNKNKNRLLNEKINDALLTGNHEKAKEIFEKVLETAKNKDERATMENSIQSSILARRPFAVYGKPGGDVGVALFYEWAEKTLPEKEFERIKAIDDFYMQAAINSGLVKDRRRLRMSHYKRKLREYRRKTRPFEEE